MTRLTAAAVTVPEVVSAAIVGPPDRMVDDEVSDLAAERLPRALVVAEVLAREDAAGKCRGGREEWRYV